MYVENQFTMEINQHKMQRLNQQTQFQALMITDPQTDMALGIESQRGAMCVRNVNVHVSCSSQFVTHFAAFFIDPRAK